MLRCRELAKMISDGSTEGAPFGRKIAIRLHLLMCAHCRRFFRQINLIGRLARESAEAKECHSPSPDDLEERLVRKLCDTSANGKGGHLKE